MPGFVIGGTGGYAGINNSADGKVETRRAYRWIFEVLESMPDQGANLVYLKTANRPELTLGQLDQHHNQEKVWHVGKTEWNDLSMSWYDVENPDVSDAIYDWLEAAVYSIPGATPQHPSTYKKQARLTVLNHEGNIQASERWTLWHCWPYRINWNTLDYSNEALLEIEASCKYDRATKD